MSVKVLQERVGTKADGVFGPMTLRAATRYYGFSDEHSAHFFGQTAHESGGFRFFTENLNYSANALMAVFSRHFSSLEEAKQYERQPEKIANRVYANRMRNGDESSGDGWKFRGRGALQLTGRANYQAFADSMDDQSIVEEPDQVSEKYAFESALFFFDTNSLWRLCDVVNTETITSLTRRINGGTNGLQDRINRTNNYYRILKGTK